MGGTAQRGRTRATCRAQRVESTTLGRRVCAVSLMGLSVPSSWWWQRAGGGAYIDAWSVCLRESRRSRSVRVRWLALWHRPY